MKYLYTLFLALFTFSAFSQIIWDGPAIMVVKDDFADFTLPENQDFLTENVILTRGDSKGFFNFAQEAEYNKPISPVGTEWAMGKISDGIATLTFQSWEESHGSLPISVLGRDMVLHLIEDDIYIDFKLIQWTGGVGQGVPGGGGFIYERSTRNSFTSIDEPGELSSVEVFPNPVQSTLNIRITDPEQGEVTVELINVVGQFIDRTLIINVGGEASNQIDVSGLEKGVYLVKISNGETIQTQKIVVQ